MKSFIEKYSKANLLVAVDHAIKHITEEHIYGSCICLFIGFSSIDLSLDITIKDANEFVDLYSKYVNARKHSHGFFDINQLDWVNLSREDQDKIRIERLRKFRDYIESTSI